jgi:hypothetical protein
MTNEETIPFHHYYIKKKSDPVSSLLPKKKKKEREREHCSSKHSIIFKSSPTCSKVTVTYKYIFYCQKKSIYANKTITKRYHFVSHQKGSKQYSKSSVQPKSVFPKNNLQSRYLQNKTIHLSFIYIHI